MSTTSRMRFSVYAAYLTALFGFMLWAYAALTRFDALLRLEGGRSERVAFAREDGAGLVALQPALPAELISFDNGDTARRLAGDDLYLAQTLPFSLRLDQRDLLRTLPPRDTIALDDHPPCDISEGAVLQLSPGEQLRVRALSEWHGLLPTPHGVHSAAMVFRTDTRQAGQTLLLEEGHWVFPNPGLAVQLQWHPTEEAARVAAAADKAPGLDAAWWTVKDGDNLTRLTNLAPGAGAECNDGSVWTVEHLEPARADPPQPPVLWLNVQDNSGAHRVAVRANDTDSEARARFHHPGGAATVVFVHAWRDGQALVTTLTAGQRANAAQQMAEGDTLPLGGEVTLYLAQVLAYGLAVPESEHSLRQALLEDSSGRQWYLREGAPLTIHGVRVAYRREQPVPDATWHLSVYFPATKATQSITLAPGERCRIGEWRLSQTPIQPPRGDPNSVYLRVRYIAFTPSRMFGLALFIGGAYGLLWIRFRPRSARETPWKSAARKVLPQDTDEDSGTTAAH